MRAALALLPKRCFEHFPPVGPFLLKDYANLEQETCEQRALTVLQLDAAVCGALQSKVGFKKK